MVNPAERDHEALLSTVREMVGALEAGKRLDDQFIASHNVRSSMSFHEGGSMRRLWLALLPLIISCAPTLQSMPDQAREEITTRTFAYPYADVFTACLERLEKRGYTIANIDSKVGILTTDWKQSESLAAKILVGNTRAKAMVRVKELSSNESKVILTIQAERQGAFGSWESVPITSDMKKSFEEFFAGVAEILEAR